MRGDFSRGHKPDRQRGRDYRRVLLQQGRPLLDSDFNAQTDANEHLIRELARALGGDSGSPDGGFLVTAGPLLACFRSKDDVQVQGHARFEAHLDYQLRYGERLPSLYLGAREGAGSVTIRFRQPLRTPSEDATASGYTHLRIWARARALPWYRVGAGSGETPLPGAAQAEAFLPYDIELPRGATVSELTLGFSANTPESEAWIGLIEGWSAQALSPGLRFWVTRGRYLVDGSPVRLAEDGGFPEVSFPRDLDFTHPEPEPGTYVAFLEAWERHVTAVEDAGLMEVALGGTVDTCTRVEAVGQVKVARLEPSDAVMDPLELQRAFAAGSTSNARLLVTDSGYGGAENWLYRFEVHAVGAASARVVLKWSRSNGAELHPVQAEREDGRVVTLPLTAVVDEGDLVVTLPLTAVVDEGDLVEALSEGTERGDDEDGHLTRGSDGAVRFIAPVRSVGALFQVRRVRMTTMGKELELQPFSWGADAGDARVPAGSATGKVGTQPRKLRRWDGHLTATVGTPVQLADGLQVSLSGSGFRVGDYWQFAARRRKSTGTGAQGEPPHGPERLFVPLARLNHPGGGKPATFERWLDEQFFPLGRLQAQALSYDGSRVYSSAGTVQEALDELYRLQRQAVDEFFVGSRRWKMVFPSRNEEDDAGSRIQAAIDDLPQEGVVCLMGGTFWLKSPLVIGDSQSIELRGFPKAAVLVKGMQSPPNDAAISVSKGASLTLRDVTLAARDGSVQCLIELAEDCRSFLAEDCGLYLPTRGDDAFAIRCLPGAHALPDRKESPDADFEKIPAPNERYPSLALHDCILVAGWVVSVRTLLSLELHDSILLCTQGGVAAVDVGSIDARRLYVDAGLYEQQLQEYMDLPELLEGKARDFARQNWFNQRDHGTALYAHAILKGALVDSTLLALMGLWLGCGRNLRIERTVICSEDTGVRMDGAVRVSLRELTLSTQGFGIHLALLASEVDILDCDVQSSSLPLLVLRPYEASSEAAASTYRRRDLSEVRIGGNRFSGRTGGIQLGPNASSHGGTPNALVRTSDVQVFDNEVHVSDEGTVINLVGICAQEIQRAEEGWWPLRITGNRIQVGVSAGPVMGIRVSGTGMELLRNEVSGTTGNLMPESEIPILIHVERSSDFVVAENIVRGSGPQLDGIGVFDGTGRASVQRNMIEATDESNEEVTLAIDVWGFNGSLLVSENDIGRGNVSFVSVADVVFRDNQLGSGGVKASGLSDGSILRNRVSRWVIVEAVRGKWCVDENIVGDEVVLTPAYRTLGEGRYMEEEFEARVNGNRCKHMQIGLFDYAFAAAPEPIPGMPDAGSIVQVTDNRVVDYLAVNSYSVRIVEHNVSGRGYYRQSDDDPHACFVLRNIIIPNPT